MRTLSILTAAGLLTWSGLAAAQDTANQTPAEAPEQAQAGKVQPTLTPAAPPSPAGWQLHGFGDVSVKNDYITPRGLVVTTRGAAVQILDGLTFVSPGGIALTAGTWTDINPGYSRRDGNITAVNEFDYFVGVSGTIAKRWKAGVQYEQFISGQPSVAFQDERNIEFSLGYDDSAPGKTFSLNPYGKLFWAFNSKSSTVVTGRAGKTYDVELGIVPTFAGSGVTFTVPTWITVGPKSYWAGPAYRSDGNFGVVSTGLKGSVPLTFVNSGGKIAVYAQAQYFHIINRNLEIAEQLLNDGDSGRDNVVFGVGLSAGF